MNTSIKIEDISLEDIQDFVANGTKSKAPPEVVELLSVLEKIHGMYLRWHSRDYIMKHLQKVCGYSYYLSGKLYDMATEYFYCERNVSKQAHRNRLSEKMEKAITLGMKMAKDTKEVVQLISKIKDVAEVLQLDKNDAEDFPEELLAKPFKMYSVDAEFLGLPKVDRYKLARFIDNFPELSEKERIALREDAGIEQFKLIKPNQENARLQQD